MVNQKVLAIGSNKITLVMHANSDFFDEVQSHLEWFLFQVYVRPFLTSCTINLSEMKEEGPLGRVFTSDFRSGNLVFHLFVNKLLRYNDPLLVCETVVSHELLHLFQLCYGRAYADRKKASDRLSHHLDSLLNSTEMRLLKDLRSFISDFARRLHIEAFADFYSSYGLHESSMYRWYLPKNEYKKLYVQVQQALENVFFGLEDLHPEKNLSLDDQRAIAKGIQEDFYFCLAKARILLSAILATVDDLGFDEVVKMGSLKFLRLYEKSSIHGLPPLFSWSSGVGIFDFKKAIDLLTLYYDKRTKRSV